MSAAVMSPTPALPMVRKASVWDKMFNGFKLGDKEEAVEDAVEDMGPTQRSRQASVASISTGVERSTTQTVHKRTDSTATRMSRAQSVFSISGKSASGRNGSVSSTFSRRSSLGGKKWWRSSNPEDDQAPPVPAIDAKFAVFGSHNPDVEPAAAVVSPAPSRRPSYVPRNAAGAFLKSTTTKAMVKNTQEVVEATRKLSVIDPKAVQAAPKAAAPVKIVELRKDSHVGLEEKNGLFSMAGICDIVEDVSEEEYSVSPTTQQKAFIVDTPLRQSEERADSARADSAKGSPELLAVNNSAQREPSLLEATVA